MVRCDLVSREYARWHTCLNCAGVGLEEVATLWEADGQLIAFQMPDGDLGKALLVFIPPDARPNWRHG